jgi:hypothetical protein
MIPRAAAGGKSQELLFAGEFIMESFRRRDGLNLTETGAAAGDIAQGPGSKLVE